MKRKTDRMVDFSKDKCSKKIGKPVCVRALLVGGDSEARRVLAKARYLASHTCALQSRGFLFASFLLFAGYGVFFLKVALFDT